MKPYRCAILYHNFYGLEGVKDIRNRIQVLDERILLLTSMPEKLFLEANIKNSTDEKFLNVTNKGKDIGGKLVLLDLVLKLYQHIPYLILLHDKKSLQKYSGSFEKEKLFEVLNPNKFAKAFELFETDKNIGIICQNECIKNEFNKKQNNFNTTNSELLKILKSQYSITTLNHQFVAGTMFWVRTSVFAAFFQKHNPIQIRATLEEGNILDNEHGTITHSWERLLSWIVTSMNYKIVGV